MFEDTNSRERSEVYISSTNFDFLDMTPQQAIERERERDLKIIQLIPKYNPRICH